MKKKWFTDEWEKGNPILKDIAEKAIDCLINSKTKKNLKNLFIQRAESYK